MTLLASLSGYLSPRTGKKLDGLQNNLTGQHLWDYNHNRLGRGGYRREDKRINGKFQLQQALVEIAIALSPRCGKAARIGSVIEESG